MAGIPTINDQDTSQLNLRRFWRFALARQLSDLNAAPYVAGFQGFGPVWTAANQQEMALEDAVTDAEAAVVAADAALDDLADKIHAAIAGLKNPALATTLRDLFFGSETVSQFKRPLLAKELSSALGWPLALAQAKQAALMALAPLAGTVVPAATAAATALDTATTERETFRLGGARKQLFDTFNSLCATAFGGLKALVHDHPELALPAGYGESFFLHNAKSPHGKTLSATAAASTKADKKAAAAKAKHDTALATEAAKVADAAAHQQKKADAKAKKKLADDALKVAKAASKAAAEALKKSTKKKV